MKKIFLAVLMIGMVLPFGSCKKDSDGNTIYKMSASIDNKQWSSIAPFANLHNGIFTLTGTSLTTGESIIIAINGELQNTYELSIDKLKTECLGTYKPTFTATTDDAYVSYIGKVVLTKVDKVKNLISGTFEFTIKNAAANQKQITIGTFTDVTFIVN